MKIEIILYDRLGANRMISFIAVSLLLIGKITTQESYLPTDFCIGKQSNSYHPYPDNCKKYVICVQEFSFPIECPSSLHFSQAEKMCNLKEVAGCEIFSTTAAPTTTILSTTKQDDITTASTRAPIVPATRCDPSKCKLPDCHCAGPLIPNNFTKAETPQMVLFAVDDAIKDSNYKILADFFNNRKNPNGCNVKATFFVSDKDTVYARVSDLAKKGHEIAVHSSLDRTDYWRSGATFDQIKETIINQKRKIESRSSVSNVLGWRSPFGITTKKILKVLYDEKFVYDNSVTVSRYERWWPYTLDALSSDYPNCHVTPCRNMSYPGLWEIPINQLGASEKVPCPLFNECFRYIKEGVSDSVYQMFLKNFNGFLNDQKQPFGIYGTMAFFDHATFGWKQNGFKRFMDEILKRDDVYFVTMQQAIAWMKNPTKLSDIKNFKPWSC